MYKLCFYVPASHVDAAKTAAFAAGGGRIGDYDSCCWQALGEGQFRPLKGSEPYLGQQGKIELVPEYKVEMVCPGDCLNAIVQAMLAAHPYETPAWDATEILTELNA